jgi:RimK family alpha-L-glutamate ligase
LVKLKSRLKVQKKTILKNLEKKQILILTMSERQSWYEVGRMLKEAEKMGVKAKRVLYKDLIFENNKVFINSEEINEKNTKGIIFRVAGTKSGKYVEARNLLLTLLGNKIKCINQEAYLNWPRMGKIPQLGVFLKNNIPIISTKIFYKKEDVLNQNWDFPIIAKHSMGFQGKSVIKITNNKELVKRLDKIGENKLGIWLWQKYLPVNWDLRIMVIGGKVIGSMKRIAKKDEFRSNFSLGGDVEKWKLSDSDRKIAEKVAKCCNLDYCGVDIMKNQEGKSFVLEVNRQCQFKGFEKATEVNVAQEIIKFIVRL